jgi:hypothetical protein
MKRREPAPWNLGGGLPVGSRSLYPQRYNSKEGIRMGNKPLPVGSEAPDFTLPAVGGEEINLKAYRGKKKVVLAFHPLAWTSV